MSRRGWVCPGGWICPGGGYSRQAGGTHPTGICLVHFVSCVVYSHRKTMFLGFHHFFHLIAKM